MAPLSKNYFSKLTDKIKKDNLLKGLIDNFKAKFNLTPMVGAELEFYLHGNIDIRTLEYKIGMKIKPEKGNNQFEVDLLPSQDLTRYARYIAKIRSDIIAYAKELGGEADFRSKPFPNDYGNSMHIHLNFLEDNNIEKYAIILCHYIPETIQYFIPSEKDFTRLDSKFMAPTHISFGGNNRTTAIRIPDSKPKRLEHRLAAAVADPYLVIYIILKSIADGLENPESISPIEKTYGNAFDPQYELKEIKFQQP